jgi:hypothetical protein
MAKNPLSCEAMLTKPECSVCDRLAECTVKAVLNEYGFDPDKGARTVVIAEEVKKKVDGSFRPVM